MIVKQSSQSSIFSLPDNNIFPLLGEVMQRACAFPYYISWKVHLLFRENFYWQETISLPFDEIFQDFPGWVDALLWLTKEKPLPFLQHTFTYLNSHVLCFFRYISDIHGVWLFGFFFFFFLPRFEGL